MTDHEAEAKGIVQETGTFTETETHSRMSAIATKIEQHGEVHAMLEGRDKEVELRLGTTRVDYSTGCFEVWDGDTYQTVPVEHITHAYKPMDVFH